MDNLAIIEKFRSLLNNKYSMLKNDFNLESKELGLNLIFMNSNDKDSFWLGNIYVSICDGLNMYFKSVDTMCEVNVYVPDIYECNGIYLFEAGVSYLEHHIFIYMNLTGGFYYDIVPNSILETYRNKHINSRLNTNLKVSDKF